MILLLTILSIITVLDAFGDAMRWKGKQKIHHIAEASVYVLMGWIVYIVNFNPVSRHDFLWLVIYGICFRIIFFNPLINLFAGRSIWYLGDSDWWDELMKRGGSILIVMALATLVAAIIRLTT